jgi:hypothetical protein
LRAYLAQHPEAFFSPCKEPNYFALAGVTLPDGGPAAPEVIQRLIHIHSITDRDEYLALFDSAQGQKVIGEASVRYLYYEQAPRRIHAMIPDARMIAILREPVGRLYSHYCMNVQFHLEPLPLREALEAEEERRTAGWGWDWHYTAVSSYAIQVKRYLELFDRRQIRFFLYDEFQADPLHVFREACRHLGIDDSFVPDMSRRGKVAYRPKHPTLDRWLRWPNPLRERITQLVPAGVTGAVARRIKRWNSTRVPELERSLRDDLRAHFRDDIRELESLIGRKTGWAD